MAVPLPISASQALPKPTGTAQTGLIRAVNHLLGQSAWASLSLRPFSGQRIKVSLPPLSLIFQITPEGLVKAPAASALLNAREPDVVVNLPANTPLLALQDQAAIFRATRIQGSADLAHTLGKLLEHLRWDAEADLSRLFGDMLAHRLVVSAHTLLFRHKHRARILAENLREFLTEERPVIVSRLAIADFSATVDRLHHDLAQLEQKLQQLAKA
jgi:ubiquinone biosynthesis protein UbiJ